MFSNSPAIYILLLTTIACSVSYGSITLKMVSWALHVPTPDLRRGDQHLIFIWEWGVSWTLYISAFKQDLNKAVAGWRRLVSIIAQWFATWVGLVVSAFGGCYQGISSTITSVRHSTPSPYQQHCPTRPRKQEGKKRCHERYE